MQALKQHQKNSTPSGNQTWQRGLPQKSRYFTGKHPLYMGHFGAVLRQIGLERNQVGLVLEVQSPRLVPTETPIRTSPKKKSLGKFLNVPVLQSSQFYGQSNHVQPSNIVYHFCPTHHLQPSSSSMIWTGLIVQDIQHVLREKGGPWWVAANVKQGGVGTVGTMSGLSWVSLTHSNTECYTGWWFEPLWKILVNWDDYSQYMGK